MALSPLGAQLTALYRRRQMAVRALTMQSVLAVWPAFDLADIDGTWPPVESALIDLVRLRRETSSSVSGQYFRQFRAAEGIGRDAEIVAAKPLSTSRLLGNLRMAGPIGTKKSILVRSTTAEKDALVRVTGATTRLVVDAGRETVANSIGADREASGWNRVTSGDPCGFCAVLASRGPSYSSESSASFEAHNFCACEPEPSYGGGLTEQAQRWSDLYNEKASGTDNPINEMRKALT